MLTSTRTLARKSVLILASIVSVAIPSGTNPYGTAYAQPTATSQPSPGMRDLQDSFSKVASDIEPAVVNVSTVIEEKVPQFEFFFGSPFEDEDSGSDGKKSPSRKKTPPTRRAEGIASGVIISPEGYILTNDHVVHEAKSIRVTLADQRKFTGKLVGGDPRSDLAVIKIKGEKLPFARLGDSDKLKVGDWAIAVGSPFGLQASVTAGIISAKRQSLSIEGNNYTNLIQTDAAINRGNSGGPLCSINGEVIGINTAIYAPTGVFSGVGFAIPINNAKVIMDSLITKGKVVRGWLGVEVRPIDEAITRQFGLADTNGVLINNIMPKSPAAIAGLQRGDVIVEANGNKVTSPADLQSMVAQTEPNKKVVLGIIRERKRINVNLMAGEMPSEEELAKSSSGESNGTEEPEPEAAAAEWQGMKVANISKGLAKRFEVPQDLKGCIVVDVGNGSTADDMGIAPGDIIVSINRIPTPTADAFKSATSKVNLADGIVLDVTRQDRQFYLSYSQK